MFLRRCLGKPVIKNTILSYISTSASSNAVHECIEVTVVNLNSLTRAYQGLGRRLSGLWNALAKPNRYRRRPRDCRECQSIEACIFVLDYSF